MTKANAPGWRAEGGRGTRSGGSPHGTPLAPASQGPTPIFSAAGHVVGHVIGDVFVKRVRERDHMLRVPPAWCCDVAALQQAERAGAVYVRLDATDTGRVWTVPLRAFYGDRAFTVSRGYGAQVALPLSAWTVSRPGEPVVRQLSLFGAAP